MYENIFGKSRNDIIILGGIFHLP